MNKLKSYLYAIGFVSLALAILIITIKFGVFKNRTETKTITAQTILNSIADNYFVVTKSAILNEEVEIKVDKGSTWSNFLWGQTVKARGLIRIDIGVNLSGLDENDIKINQFQKTVSINIPRAEILDASQYGPIEVNSKQGVLKYLLDNDPNADHNRALEQLITEARTAISSDERLFNEAHRDTTKLLEMIVKNFGYSLVNQPSESTNN